ncbi:MULTISPECIES: LysR family transcriptional regulator [Pectobacterium]|uniref:LysR family transcriptional regulator n=1 Tax=Pectobacterium TaxID=122277 RepID=UPI000C1B9950|nr:MULTISPECIES: LysR family transcriptional regulator [Pectobacterium]ATV42067.1 LysR family transcriptional regulator [Pectobacterium brasiliense]MBA0207732.1 LysR family transcriptional regulator [Pectobacterium brasiliense]MBE5221284.1 LysR family transcriptional regulator [Pectobacterium quasiaquaticum]MCA6983652.1 LysR family transcriptional regulator [Pectobacterium brasiliense]MCH4993203.1 LysR family transcriptional regulator [Pectobacterium brasiliense]
MRRDDLSDLAVFLAVAEEHSFTRAAARLQTSQSSLSNTIRRLEARLGLRLLNRTTRSVAPTQAGEQLLNTLRPAFADIDARLTKLSELREKPSGTIRITTSLHAAQKVLWPAIARLLPDYPDLKIECSIDAALTDIVTDRFDAGIRLGEEVDKDMIALRISPDLRMVVVGAPAYFKSHPVPETPHDLTGHDCINVRLPTSGGLYTWEFAEDARQLNVRVDGSLVFNDMSMVIKACCEGFGLACVIEDQVKELVADGTLIQVLDDWCPFFPGFHLYYPSRRQPSPAFTLLVEALRYTPQKPASRKRGKVVM